MNNILGLSESLLNEITSDPTKFVSKIIDISTIHNSFVSNLNWDLLEKNKLLEVLGISGDELLKEEVARRIRISANKVNIPIITIDKETTDSEIELISFLSKNRILLLK